MWWIGITAASGSLSRAPWGHHINPRSISETFSVVLNGFATGTGHLDSMLLRASQATMHPSSPFNKSACKRTLHSGMASGMLHVLRAQPQAPHGADMRRRYASCMAAMPGSRTGLRLSSPSRRSHVSWHHPLQLKFARNSGIAHYSEEAAERVDLEESLQERFDAQRLLEAIVYEADRGCLNAQGKARFSNFLRAQLEAWVSYIDSPSSDGGRTETIVSLLAEARKYAVVMPLQRRALLDKIAKLLGYETPLNTSVQTNATDGSAIMGASTKLHPSANSEFSAAVNIPAVEQLTPSSKAVPVNLNNLVQQSAEPSMSKPAKTFQDALWAAKYPIPSTAKEVSANPGSPPVVGAASSLSSSASASPPTTSDGEAWSSRLARHHPAISFGYSEPVNLRWAPSGVEKAAVMEVDAMESLGKAEEETGMLSSVSIAVEVLEEEEGEKSVRHEMVAALEQVGGDVAKMEERTSVSIRAKRRSAVAEARKAKSRGDAPRKVEVVGGVEVGVEVGVSQVETVQVAARAGKGKGSGCLDPDWLLDTPISTVKCLTPAQRRKLEAAGFVTVRSLLQHYPRLYIDYEMAQQNIAEGKHVICVGRILSSRGYSKGYSLGIVEVTVEFIPEAPVNARWGNEGEDGDDEAAKPKPVYIHLYKFLRGAKFITGGFLQKLAMKYPLGARAAVSGKVKALSQANHFTMREFDIKLLDLEGEEGCEDESEVGEGSAGVASAVEGTGGPEPVYPTKNSLNSKTVGECIRIVVRELPEGLDPLPKEKRESLGLMELRKALQSIHAPAVSSAADNAKARLVFDEFLYHQLGVLLHRQQTIAALLHSPFDPFISAKAGGSLLPSAWSPLARKVVASLPYSLTRAQSRVVSEIMWDLQKAVPMNRLLQGDVGCGKTIVAFLALVEIVAAGYQGVIMAPTEFLAVQHFARFTSLLETLDKAERPTIALLTGSTPTKRAKGIREEIRRGQVKLVVGTHSLISRGLEFPCLGLAVIDEQHRFGVEQRQKLQLKGASGSLPTSGSETESDTTSENDGPATSSDNGVSLPVPLRAPHVLAMSATPIPRSLALAVHGDMALSQIDELPPGRTPITTRVMQSTSRSRKEAYQLLKQQISDGGRAFIVFPVIEESENFPDLRSAVEEYEELQKGHLSGFRCGLVHGRLPPAEKEEAMRKFKEGETQVLVSTTVIEVGIDIPEASVMVVEHAERYGMAQLHQLRGRVGRGVRESLCILLASNTSSLARLRALETSQDGFHLAELDMHFRGPGDLLGKRQSGHLPDFTLARLEEDGEVMVKARDFAQQLLMEYPNLDGLPALRRELSMRRPPIGLG